VGGEGREGGFVMLGCSADSGAILVPTCRECDGSLLMAKAGRIRSDEANPQAVLR
jgi:hypothetical protein